ncbi:MAG TPA: dTMP kinase [Geobacteraceae bacterium]|jgi:dTMP kinase|nr:dTMP kinase [Geobacteraceae bacterium]
MACFITFEGIEGCGKTTQMKLLSERLAKKGYPVVVTREPGGCPIALKIREILLDAANSAMVPLAELFLYAAARAQHVAEIIKPALDAGDIVLCDRFTDATIAYQGFGRELDLPLIEELNRLATGQVQPQLTILIDCPVEIGLSRAISRIDSTTGAREERFELESVQFHRRVRDGYLRLAAENPDRFIVIDGNRNIEGVEETINDAVLARLAEG